MGMYHHQILKVRGSPKSYEPLLDQDPVKIREVMVLDNVFFVFWYPSCYQSQELFAWFRAREEKESLWGCSNLVSDELGMKSPTS